MDKNELRSIAEQIAASMPPDLVDMENSPVTDCTPQAIARYAQWFDTAHRRLCEIAGNDEDLLREAIGGTEEPKLDIRPQEPLAEQILAGAAGRIARKRRPLAEQAAMLADMCVAGAHPAADMFALEAVPLARQMLPFAQRRVSKVGDGWPIVDLETAERNLDGFEHAGRA